MSWPYSPRTRRRPMGPGSPMWIFGLARSYFAAGGSDRAARGPPDDGALESRRGGDENLLPPAFDEADRSLDLGAHGSLGELALLQVLLGLRNGDPVEPLLVRLAGGGGGRLHPPRGGGGRSRHAGRP